MITPYPFVASSAWDRLTIAGIAFSGRALVEDAGRKRKVDVANRSGADGAYLTIQRRELAEPTLTLTGWTEAHMREMERIARAVFPTERMEAHNPVAVVHPLLAFHAIERLFVHEVAGPTPGDHGLFTLVLSTYQWRPPPARGAARRPAPVTNLPTAFTGLVPPPAPTPAPASPAATAAPRRR